MGNHLFSRLHASRFTLDARRSQTVGKYLVSATKTFIVQRRMRIILFRNDDYRLLRKTSYSQLILDERCKFYRGVVPGHPALEIRRWFGWVFCAYSEETKHLIASCVAMFLTLALSVG